MIIVFVFWCIIASVVGLHITSLQNMFFSVWVVPIQRLHLVIKIVNKSKQTKMDEKNNAYNSSDNF